MTERRQREQVARRAAVLEAALHVLATRGIRRATMAEIATAAELGKGTIYYYFPSKEAIVKELLQDFVDHHFDGLPERVAGATTPLEIAEEIVRGTLENYRAHRELFRLFYSLLLRPGSPDLRAEFAARHRGWHRRLEEIMKDKLQGGPLSPRSLVEFVGIHVHGLLLLAVLGQDLERLEEETSKTLHKLL